MLAYIADRVPKLGLLPGTGSRERYDALRWMAYLASTVHPALDRLWRPEHFASDGACMSSIEQAAAKQLAEDFTYIDEQIAEKKWIAGPVLSVADLHLFVFGRLGLRLTPSTREFSNFYRHTVSVAALTATARAMKQQEVSPWRAPSRARDESEIGGGRSCLRLLPLQLKGNACSAPVRYWPKAGIQQPPADVRF